MVKNIIFAGHFSLGEKRTPAQIKTIEEALKLEGDLGIVVNDIGFRRRLIYASCYGEGSLPMRCTKPSCGMSRSKIATEIEVNLEEYSLARELFLKNYKKNIFEAETDKEAPKIIKKEVIPSLVELRLKAYGVSIPKNRIFLETKLRNYAGDRLKRARFKNNSGWISYLKDFPFSLSSDSTPNCRAIMLASYEKAANLGYNKIIQLYPELDKIAIENGTATCMLLHERFPKNPVWNLDFENRYF